MTTPSDKLVKAYLTSYKKRYFQLYNEFWSNILIDLEDSDSASRILDCGCGIGLLFKCLCDSYNEIYALEPNAETVKNIIYKSEKIKKVVVKKTEDMEFPDSFFDVVFCRTSIHHFTDIKKGLSQIKRILKNGGYLITSEPCRDNCLWRYIGVLYTSLSKRFDHPHHHIFTSDELHTLLNLYGFEIEYMIRFGYIGFLIAGIPYCNIIMNAMPSSARLGNFLITLDKFFTKMPVLKEFSWHVIIKARKI